MYANLSKIYIYMYIYYSLTNKLFSSRTKNMFKKKKKIK